MALRKRGRIVLWVAPERTRYSTKEPWLPIDLGKSELDDTERRRSKSTSKYIDRGKIAVAVAAVEKEIADPISAINKSLKRKEILRWNCAPTENSSAIVGEEDLAA